ncbi:TPA: hypothetical protein ACVTHL_005487 [Bacillus cereus]|uniref:hypothetical protein n=1 Tax=Bacillus cereus TaxID=1396 RepID=UPI0007AB5E9D|nr:hypothetical protein [Bacillus cereus]KZD72339.1 putative Membrane Spanning Protein [Bacillus cereus]
MEFSRKKLIIIGSSVFILLFINALIHSFTTSGETEKLGYILGDAFIGTFTWLIVILLVASVLSLILGGIRALRKKPVKVTLITSAVSFGVSLLLFVMIGLLSLFLGIKDSQVISTNTTSNTVPQSVANFINSYNDIAKRKENNKFTINTDLKLKTVKYDSDVYFNAVDLIDIHEKAESESFRLILDDSKEDIEKITYSGSNIEVFILTIGTLNLEKNPTVDKMFLELDKKRDMLQTEFESTIQVADCDITFHYNASESAAPISFIIKKI